MIAVLADTHMPKGGRTLPERCVELLREAEATLHAGDFFGLDTLREIEALCPGPVHAVRGNVDEAVLRRLLPETIEVGLAGARVAMVHDAGPSKGRLRRMRRRFPAADAVVFGHSHLPLHEEEDGFQIFNPGSPTERRRSPHHSIGLLRVESGHPVFEHVWLRGEG
ncbi:MAG TPA: metallophosphoesterase family protein [Solirubrobacterales bacterium]|nr:metallophosphoesterase family protein [Solirubrobacterales bacterium]